VPSSGSARLVARNDKLRAAVGWAPAIGLSEGIARTIAWHRDSRHADGCPRTLGGDGNAA